MFVKAIASLLQTLFCRISLSLFRRNMDAAALNLRHKRRREREARDLERRREAGRSVVFKRLAQFLKTQRGNFQLDHSGPRGITMGAADLKAATAAQIRAYAEMRGALRPGVPIPPDANASARGMAFFVLSYYRESMSVLIDDPDATDDDEVAAGRRAPKRIRLTLPRRIAMLKAEVASDVLLLVLEFVPWNDRHHDCPGIALVNKQMLRRFNVVAAHIPRRMW